MPLIIKIAFICLVFVSCKGTEPLAPINKKGVEVSIETYWILVQFKNPEGLKRTLYRLDKFKIAMEEELSTSDNMYRFRLEAKPYEIDGIVEKLRLNEDVQWAKRAD